MTVRRHYEIKHTEQCEIWPDLVVPFFVKIHYTDFLILEFLVVAAAHSKTTDYHKKENEVCERRYQPFKHKSSHPIFSICKDVHQCNANDGIRLQSIYSLISIRFCSHKFSPHLPSLTDSFFFFTLYQLFFEFLTKDSLFYPTLF